MYRLHGEKQVAIALENRMKASSQAARDAMEDFAEDIAELAAAQAPRDTGALEGAFRVQKRTGGWGRRNVWYVYVKGDVLNKKGRQVGFYAEAMHDENWNPGKGSQAKNTALRGSMRWPGAYVGPEYLTRALDFYYDDILEELGNASRKELERRSIAKALRKRR